MDVPVFKLEGVLDGNQSDFEGPLALILQLLSKNKIEIRDISISLILEQYLEFLGEMESLNLEIASEFVTMASHLAYIKTKMLLAQEEEIEELEELISSLEQLSRSEIYDKIKPVAQIFLQMYTQSAVMLPGPPEFLPEPEDNITYDKNDLIRAFWEITGRGDEQTQMALFEKPIMPSRVIYSIPQKISEILEKLRICGVIPLKELFADSKNRAELVASFIAVLELCKEGSVLLAGDGEDMTIAWKIVT